MAEVADLSRLQIVVRRPSTLGPEDWVKIVRIEETVTVHVPDERVQSSMEVALRGLSPFDAVSLDVLGGRLPIDDSLGPASLFYATTELPPSHDDSIEVVDIGELTSLFAAAPPEDLDESGLTNVRLPVSGVRSPDGDVVAACGHMLWPFDIAHLSVLTHPDHRGRGLAQRVGAHAVERVASTGLIPQWRARVEASKAVARGIGLSELGTQLRILLRDT
jgi:GNAT superfamily N-acetyltransferase